MEQSKDLLKRLRLFWKNVKYSRIFWSYQLILGQDTYYYYECKNLITKDIDLIFAGYTINSLCSLNSIYKTLIARYETS